MLVPVSLAVSGRDKNVRSGGSIVVLQILKLVGQLSSVGSRVSARLVLFMCLLGAVGWRRHVPCILLTILCNFS